MEQEAKLREKENENEKSESSKQTVLDVYRTCTTAPPRVGRAHCAS